MRKKLLPLIPLFMLIAVLGAAGLFLKEHSAAVLDTKGTIGNQERHLILTATSLMLIVVVPVYLLMAGIVLRYRADNKKAKYTPDWDRNTVAESIWWGLPFAIIFILAVIAWQSSHQLDPFRPLTSSKKTMNIQVISLDWKWLFIYPDQHIATVNYVEFPKSTPIDFEITSDAPMNSFWIPQLGGQIYSMSGMSTHLHLIADEAGTYQGSSANISGKGFAGMRFVAKAVNQSDYSVWLAKVRSSDKKLTFAEYDNLASPSENNPQTDYAWAQDGVYDRVIDKYMGPHVAGEHQHGGAD